VTWGEALRGRLDRCRSPVESISDRPRVAWNDVQSLMLTLSQSKAESTADRDVTSFAR